MRPTRTRNLAFDKAWLKTRNEVFNLTRCQPNRNPLHSEPKVLTPHLFKTFLHFVTSLLISLTSFANVQDIKTDYSSSCAYGPCTNIKSHLGNIASYKTPLQHHPCSSVHSHLDPFLASFLVITRTRWPFSCFQCSAVQHLLKTH